jgi:formate hydrogenlyase transcriptional activator
LASLLYPLSHFSQGIAMTSHAVLDSTRRRIEHVFNEIERENQLILRAAGEGIYGVNAEGLTTFANPAAERMLGWRTDELVGRNIHTVIHHSHPDGSCYPGHECPIYAAFRDGAVHKVDDEVFWHKDGRAFPVEYTSTPIHDDGRLVGAVVVFRDVSDRREAEMNLRQALAEVEALKQRLEMENAYLQEEIRAENNYREIVGRSAAVRHLIRHIEMVAPTDAPVLITGESGTGKELIARAIHESSSRSQRPLIRVNCAAIPRDLFESEFFGHIKGAFTGAINDRTGRFELADGGTLFLDEVGEIPPELQSKLLRVLQDQQFERVGDTRTRRVNVRVIAATNRELKQAVAEQRFREDLYFRLNVFPIESLPLRARLEDIPLLAAHFLKRACQKFNKPDLQLTLADVQRLQTYHWPGNIRELENIIERQVIVTRDRRLRFDLPHTLTSVPAAAIGEHSQLQSVDRERTPLARSR